MKLFVMRHGHSPSLGEAGVLKDEDRPLSRHGHLDAADMAKRLLEKEGTPQIILASPLKRAVETAKQAYSILKPLKGIHIFEPLSNRVSADTLYTHIRKEIAGVSQALVVGHQPQLGEFTAFLTGRSIAIRPAGIVALELGEPDDKRAELLWFLNPELPL